MQYLDRNNIASARLAGKVGMTKELGLTGVEYQVCICDSTALSQYSEAFLSLRSESPTIC